MYTYLSTCIHVFLYIYVYLQGASTVAVCILVVELCGPTFDSNDSTILSFCTFVHAGRIFIYVYVYMYTCICMLSKSVYTHLYMHVYTRI